MSILFDLDPQLKGAQDYINQLTALDQKLSPDPTELDQALAAIPSVILGNAAIYKGIMDSGIFSQSEFREHLDLYPNGALHGLVEMCRQVAAADQTFEVGPQKRYDGF